MDVTISACENVAGSERSHTTVRETKKRKANDKREEVPPQRTNFSIQREKQDSTRAYTMCSSMPLGIQTAACANTEPQQTQTHGNTNERK